VSRATLVAPGERFVARAAPRETAPAAIAYHRTTPRRSKETTMTTRPVLALAVAALSLTATPRAFADEAVTVTTKRVATAGMDLADPQDARKLYRRLRDAAQDVCAYSSATGAYSHECAKQALDASVARLGSSTVDALHRASHRG
jgi:UrcA family protein